MFCKNCGTELPDNTHYCTNCGFDQTAAYTPMRDPDGRPRTNMILAILVTVCCCVPFGIVGIVYASRVDSAWNTGHFEEAEKFSRKARNWSLWGLALSLLFYIAYIILIVAGVSWAMWWDDLDTFYTFLA